MQSCRQQQKKKKKKKTEKKRALDPSAMSRKALQLWAERHEDEGKVTPFSNSAKIISAMWDHEIARRNYRGVRRCNNANQFRADIMAGPRGNLFIGVFPTITAAASAYNRLARELHGEGCFQNVIEHPLNS